MVWLKLSTQSELLSPFKWCMDGLNNFCISKYPHRTKCLQKLSHWDRSNLRLEEKLGFPAGLFNCGFVCLLLCVSLCRCVSMNVSVFFVCLTKLDIQPSQHTFYSNTMRIIDEHKVVQSIQFCFYSCDAYCAYCIGIIVLSKLIPHFTFYTFIFIFRLNELKPVVVG